MPMFEFAFKAAPRQNHYPHHTWWDKAIPITVTAATKQEAVDIATAALGDLGPSNYWVFRTVSIRQTITDRKDNND